MACERREARDVSDKKVSFHCKRVSCGASTYWMWKAGRRATLHAIHASNRSSRWCSVARLFSVFRNEKSEILPVSWNFIDRTTDRMNERTTSTKGWPVCFSPLFCIRFEFNTHQFPLFFSVHIHCNVYLFEMLEKEKNQSEHHFVVVLYTRFFRRLLCFGWLGHENMYISFDFHTRDGYVWSKIVKGRCCRHKRKEWAIGNEEPEKW